jgi:outer membrane protein TolC
LKRCRFRVNLFPRLLYLLLLLSAFRPPFPVQALEAETRGCDLAAAISMALKNSRALAEYRLEQQVARAVQKLACRQFFPALELGISRDDSVVYDSPDSRSRRLSVGLRQLIYDGGRTRAGLERRRREIAQARFDLEAESEELIWNVITLYTEILEFRQKRQIQQETYSSAVLQHGIAREELRLGALTELEFLDFDIRLKNLELELERTDQEQRLLLFRFGRLLGSDPDAAPPVPAGRLNPDYNGFIPELDGDHWRGLALQRNPDLRKIRMRVQEQDELLRQAARSWLPEIRGSFSAFASGPEYPLSVPGFEAGVELHFQLPVLPMQAAGAVGKTSPEERSLAGSASFQVLEGLEDLYSKKLARLHLSQAAGDLDALMTEIAFKIRELLFNIGSLKKSLRLLREQLGIEVRRSRLQELRLALGQIKRIDVLDSELELARLSIELVGATVDLYNEEVSLLRLCGQPGLAETHKFIVIPGD